MGSIFQRVRAKRTENSEEKSMEIYPNSVYRNYFHRYFLGLVDFNGRLITI